MPPIPGSLYQWTRVGTQVDTFLSSLSWLLIHQFCGPACSVKGMCRLLLIYVRQYGSVDEVENIYLISATDCI